MAVGVGHHGGSLSAGKPQDRLPLLDTLRTVAAVGVMLYHMPGLFRPTWLFSRNYLFVDLFFLLSGFVLTLSAEPRMAGRSPLLFVRARLRRLWPLAALATLAGAIAFLPGANMQEIFPLVLLGLAMVPMSRSGFAAFPLNGPQWSLLWELIANAVHASLLWRLGPVGLRLFVAAAGVLLCVAIASTGACEMGPNGDNWWLAAPRVCWSYGLGILMARSWRQGAVGPRLDWRIALAAPFVFLQALAWSPLPLAIGDAITVLVVLPSLFWLAVHANPPHELAGTLQRLGMISFPLYALHQPFLLLGTYATLPLAGGLGGALGALVASLFLVRVWPSLALGKPRLTTNASA